MLKTLVSRNPDLELLLKKGYALTVDSGHLIVRDIPYLDSEGQLQWSALASKLVYEDQAKVRPSNHQMYFAGPRPFGLDGEPVRGLGGGEGALVLSERCNDIKMRQLFSHKLKENGQFRDYVDYFEKVESYVTMICAPAMNKFGASPCTYNEYEEEVPNSVFKLRDTLTSRAEITDLAKLFEHDVVAIIGLGGSGSYLLDFLVKTPVKEIRAFDADDFFVHNAFRSPGRVDTTEGRELRKSKAEVYFQRYENFRHGLNVKPLYIDETAGEEFEGVTFAFVAVDKGSSRQRIFDLLIAMKIPFIDVGMGLKRQSGPISGMVRTTYFAEGDQANTRAKGLVPEADRPDDVYKSNIQISELNALNAALAMLKFKQIRGFYCGPAASDHMLFTLDNLSLLAANED
jgi:molybdopterin/thiamine biosynthesis adenylyltransferase